jgi:tetratricopeptide (TPR) repeat protein
VNRRAARAGFAFGFVVAARGTLAMVVSGGAPVPPLSAGRPLAAARAVAADVPSTAGVPLTAAARLLAGPSERRIARLEERLAASPSDPEILAGLAAAYMDRGRVTADASWYARAEAACDRALRVAPGHYAAVRLRSWILAGQHRFQEAAAAARVAIGARPSDPWNYGTLGDALVETGDYAGATLAFQRMIDLRPDTSSYARGAYLRELFGDTDGAIELMSLAAQGRLEEASALYAKAVSIAPLPALAAEYGDVLQRLGRPAEARRQYDLVEVTGRIQEASTGLFDRQVALFLADHGLKSEAALRIAERELLGRKDIYGYDAVAWCALRAGRVGRARETIRQALRLHTRDAKLDYHAGMIALASGDRPGARRHLRRALGLNPHFDLRGADEARAALASLEARP